jgi:hypothetical protein
MNESEGSLYNILREKRVMQWIWQGEAGREDGGRQTIRHLGSNTV